MSLQVGISTPFDLWSLPPEMQRSRLAAIADDGIDHVFTADHVSFVNGSGIDGPVHLAMLGGLEPRLRLYLGVYLLALRHPMVAARQLASLAEIAPGRVTVGIGVGGEDRHEIEVCGVDPTTRGKRTDAALAMVRALLDGETVDGDGRFFDLTGGRIRPRPRTPVPFVVGGRSDAALVRAGTLGDGWLATWCSVGRFGSGVARVEELAGDREVAWNHGLQLWIGVGATAPEARAHVAGGMEGFYKIPFERFEKYTPFGDAERIAEFIAPYVEAGAATLNLTPCGPDRESEVATVAEIKRLLAG